MAAAPACSDEAPPLTGPEVARIQISQASVSFASLGESVTVTAQISDASGATVSAPVLWSSRDPSVATVSGGTIQSVADGATEVIAVAGTVADTMSVAVSQVAVSVEILGVDTLFTVGVPTRMSLAATDAVGSAYLGSADTWTVSDPGRASIEAGVLTPLVTGDIEVHVLVDDQTATKTVSVSSQIALEVPPEVARALQWAMEDTAAANGVIGASAAVFIPGVGTWRGVTGRSDESAVLRPEMMFYPGSIQKTLTSAVLLSLVSDGLVSLDDTVGTWLGPFANPNIPMGVSVRQLLDNTSGIYSFTTHPSLGDSLFADANRVWDPRGILETFVLPADFAPGASWKASNSSYMLGSMISEAVTGQTMAELLRTRVWEPMGIGQAMTAFFDPPPAPIAATWRGPAGGPLVSSADLMTPAAHTLLWPQPLVSAQALMRFGQEFFGDFLSESVRAEMLTAIPDDGFIPNQVGGGLGVRTYDFLGRTQWGHSGSQGAGSGFLLWDQGSGIVIALLHNQSGGSHFSSHFRLIPELLRLALEAQSGAPAGP